jgi:hypothetical protein
MLLGSVVEFACRLVSQNYVIITSFLYIFCRLKHGEEGMHAEMFVVIRC